MTIKRLAALATTAAFLIACGSDNPPADSRETILSGYSCPNCVVVAESIAFLGHPDDTVALAQDGLPAMDSRGRFYLPSGTGGAVHVFGPNGRLMKTFGKAGKGPGEFAGISEVHVGMNDSLLIVGAGTVHVLAPDYTHVRQFSVQSSGGFYENTLLSDGRMLRAQGWNQFVLVDMQGSASQPVLLAQTDTIACYGECDRGYRESTSHDAVWSARQDVYSVDRHSLSGALEQRFVRKANWFPPRHPPKRQVEGATDPDELIEYFALPRLFGVRQSPSGIVWTHVVMVEDVESLRGKVKDDGPQDFAKVLAKMITWVEAIDPVEKKLLAGIKLPNGILALTGDYSAQLIADPSGDWSWRILRFRLERK